MRLRDLSLLTDENIHPAVVAFLRSEGFDVVDIREIGWAGRPDTKLLDRSVAERRVVVTHDRDFGTLALAANAPVHGILYLRPGHIDPAFTTATLQALLRQHLSILPPFVLVAERRGEHVKIRLRQLRP